MEARKIIIFDSQTSMKKEIMSTATVWGDLKAEAEMSFENKKVVEKDTRVTLENDAAKLPEGEFTIYLFQEKSKYGNDDKNIKVLRKLRKINQKLDILMDMISNGRIVGIAVAKVSEEVKDANIDSASQSMKATESIETLKPVEDKEAIETAKLEDEAAALRAEMGL